MLGLLDIKYYSTSLCDITLDSRALGREIEGGQLDVIFALYSGSAWQKISILNTARAISMK